ncbi:MAG: hemerythrin family protein [Magnetococcus sp. YQC-9]
METRVSFMPDRYRLGCASIDTQHELIFAIYHELLRSVELEQDGYDMASVFLCLNGYAATHFKHEETLMRSAGFPGMEDHLHEHRSMVRQIGVFRERFLSAASAEAERVVAREVAGFLLAWLEHHISEVDRELCAYLLVYATEFPDQFDAENSL